MVIGSAGSFGQDKRMKMADAMAVVAGRSVRPCDVCGRKKSRLYCAADDAYLCDPCDSSVHAANALSMRHERVRLAPNGAPMKLDRKNTVNQTGLHMQNQSRKKVKTKAGDVASQQTAAARAVGGFVVPSVDASGVKMEFVNGNCFEDDGEFADDHFTAEDFSGNANLPGSPRPGYASGDSDFARNFLFSDPTDANFSKHDKSRTNRDKSLRESNGERGREDEMIGVVPTDDGTLTQNWMNHINGCIGNGNMYAVDTAALRERNDGIIGGYGDAVGLPGTKAGNVGFKNGVAQPEWMKWEDLHQDTGCISLEQHGFNPCDAEGLKRRKDYNVALVPSLRLDIEDVMSSWHERAGLWMSEGQGTDSPGSIEDPNSSSMGMASDEGRVPSALGRSASGGGEDSARSSKNARKEKVSRYMEKRKTRLHHNNGKMIRYQVRKINAERRPRDKGRFVKRSPGGE